MEGRDLDWTWTGDDAMAERYQGLAVCRARCWAPDALPSDFGGGGCCHCPHFTEEERSSHFQVVVGGGAGTHPLLCNSESQHSWAMQRDSTFRAVDGHPRLG